MKSICQGILFSCMVSICHAQCENFKDNSESPRIREAVNKCIGIMRDHEFFTLPQSSVIIAGSYSFSSVFCPQNDKIVVVDGQVIDILKQLNYLKRHRTIESLPVDSVIVGVHATLTHEFIHFLQKKDGYDGQFTGDAKEQKKEYHADFCAGYLNARSIWLTRRGIAGLACAQTPLEVFAAVAAVLDPNVQAMQKYYVCLETVMKEYQFVNGLSAITDCAHGLELERTKAYLNGFIAALNYGIKTWNPGDDKPLMILLRKYGTVDEVKVRFAKNLFEFLKTKFPVIDEQLWKKQVVMTDQYLSSGFFYTNNLQFCK